MSILNSVERFCIKIVLNLKVTAIEMGNSQALQAISNENCKFSFGKSLFEVSWRTLQTADARREPKTDESQIRHTLTVTVVCDALSLRLFGNPPSATVLHGLRLL